MKGSFSEVGLSPRELDIVRANADYTSQKALAEHFHLAERTIAHHLGTIYDKTGCDNRVDLLVWSIRKGLVVIPVEASN